MTSSSAADAPTAPKAVRSSGTSASLPAVPKSSRTKKKATSAAAAKPRPASDSGLPLTALVAGGVGALGLVALTAWALVSGRRRGSGQDSKSGGGKGSSAKGPCSKLKPTSRCVPLADGSGCVVRREIPADNSCLFNSVGYAMHRSKTRAPHLRNVVAQQVSGDRATYSDAFLGMSNEAYCAWIRQPYNWGGGIELAILAQAYGIEIAAWNIESKKEHVFGEESGYKKQVMVIYNGVHYDALAVCAHPRANPDDDELNYNPRGKRGKMIIAAARKLTELAHKESAFNGAAEKKAAAAAAAAAKKAATASAKTNGTTAAAAATTPSTGSGASSSTATSGSNGSNGTNGSSSASGKAASGARSGKPRVARSAAAAAASTAAGAAQGDGAPAAGPGSGASGSGSGLSSGAKLSCGDCGVVLDGPAAAQQHAHSTGHVSFSEVAAA